MAVCPKCEHDNDADVLFCAQCGASMTGSEGGETQMADVDEAGQEHASETVQVDTIVEYDAGDTQLLEQLDSEQETQQTAPVDDSTQDTIVGLTAMPADGAFSDEVSVHDEGSDDSTDDSVDHSHDGSTDGSVDLSHDGSSDVAVVMKAKTAAWTTVSITAMTAVATAVMKARTAVAMVVTTATAAAVTEAMKATGARSRCIEPNGGGYFISFSRR